MKKVYTPIGTRWYDIKRVGDKNVYGLQDINDIIGLIDEAKKQYGPTVKVESFMVSHGHSNRDGQYTEDNRSHFKLVYEGPAYSLEDERQMVVDRMQAAFENMQAQGQVHVVPEDQYPELMKLIKTSRNKNEAKNV